MVDSWGPGAIMGTTAPEIGHAVLQTAAVLTSDAGQSSGGETPKLVGRKLRRMYITRGDLPLQKTIFCLATLLSRLLMHGSAVRGLRLIDTPRRGARDLSCLHGRDCAARKVRASASEVKDGGGYDHPLTHGPVFQRDKRIIERLIPETLFRSNPHAEAVRAAQEFRY